METYIDFLPGMIMIGGLIGLMLEWWRKDFMRGLWWVMMAMTIALPLRVRSEATVLSTLAWCVAALGLLQFVGLFWFFRWIPRAALRPFHATGRFFLCFALSCGLIALSELYVKHDPQMSWPPGIYAIIAGGSIVVFSLVGLSFLMLDYITEDKQKPA